VEKVGVKTRRLGYRGGSLGKDEKVGVKRRRLE